MVDALDISQGAYLRDRAIVLTNFYTASRSADLGTYRITDVARFPARNLNGVWSPGGIDLTLRQSKTNNQVGRKTETRTMFFNTAHPQYCGPTAVLEWMAWMSAMDIRQGALYRPFTKISKLGKPGVLLRGHHDALDYRMDGFSFTLAVRRAAQAAGLPYWEEFTCHSLRRGRATQQRELGVDPLDIARAYGWVPGGAINVYFDEADRHAPTAPGSVGLL